jgi:hypothetical protein
MRRIGLLVLLVVSIGAGEERDEDGWPRLLTFDDGSRLVLHAPQIKGWRDFKSLEALLAATIELPDAKREAFGTIRLRAATEVDHRRGVALIREPEVVEVNFPALGPDQLKRARSVVERAARVGTEEVALDDVIPGAATGSGEVREVAVANTPPKVIVSRKAALLIVFAGAPEYVPIEGTDLLLALNTPSLLFKHAKTGWHYLFGWGSWIKARDLKGRWVPAPTLPSTFNKLPDEPLWSGLKKYIPGKALPAADVPVVHVATEPTELLVTFGEPNFEPIPDTNLMYLANTESDVFLHSKDGLYYWLVSGRWYRTQGTDRPLEFCTDKLPADFARIPADHPAGRVLASVPGTPAAAEALFANGVPRKATVKRADVKLEVSAPAFVGVTGAAGVEWAPDADLDVFRVGDRYYACSDGLWFASAKASGQYELADAVPDALYAIPPEHHAFNVTYVRVASSDAESVTYAHTAGYYGSYASGGVVVWGTGRESPETPGALRRGWDNRRYWLERWDRPQMHVWHRSLTYGQGRWYDHESGVFRVGFDAMSHAKVRTATEGAYRTWRGKAVLPAEAREKPEPEPEPKAKPRKRVAKNQAQLYGGPNGEVYKREHGDWYRYKGGKWVHLSGKPTLQSEVKKKEVSRAYRERRRSEYRRCRRRYRYRRGRVIYRGAGWGWCGGGVGIGLGGGTTVARGLMMGCW